MADEWFARFDALRRFHANHGRLPRRSIGGRATSAEELGLLSWLRSQRRREVLLTVEQWHALDSLDESIWEPRDARWFARLRDLETFVEETGRSPRVRSTDRVERGLAHWISRQRSLLRKRELSASRVDGLRNRASER